MADLGVVEEFVDAIEESVPSEEEIVVYGSFHVKSRTFWGFVNHVSQNSFIFIYIVHLIKVITNSNFEFIWIERSCDIHIFVKGVFHFTLKSKSYFLIF